METETKRLGKTPSIRRMPLYLNRLKAYQEKGMEIVTSNDIAADIDVLPIVVKKDLQLVEPPTKKRAGYIVNGTIKAITAFLGWDKQKSAILIGVGHLGSALLGYRGFPGLTFVAAFDTDVKKIGTTIHNIPVLNISNLSDFLKKRKIEIAVLTMPSEHAQKIVDLLTQGNILAIWNFTRAKIHVPPHVALQREDLSAGLAELSAKIKNNQ